MKYKTRDSNNTNILASNIIINIVSNFAINLAISLYIFYKIGELYIINNQCFMKN